MGLAEHRARLTVPAGQSEEDHAWPIPETTMSSPSRPLPDPSRLDIMFWLPPGGVDNGVWASAWAELADLDAAEVAPVLRLLADADVGGYVGTPGGGIKRPDRRAIHRLWVDSLQYHRAEDVLMAFLHNRSGRGQPGSPGF
jgi:hypothetical protein